MQKIESWVEDIVIEDDIKMLTYSLDLDTDGCGAWVDGQLIYDNRRAKKGLIVENDEYDKIYRRVRFGEIHEAQNKAVIMDEMDCPIKIDMGVIQKVEVGTRINVELEVILDDANTNLIKKVKYGHRVLIPIIERKVLVGLYFVEQMSQEFCSRKFMR